MSWQDVSSTRSQRLLSTRKYIRHNDAFRYNAAMHEIRTERLLLRKAREGDLDAIHSVLSNPEATTYWYEPPHSTVQQSKEWLISMMRTPEQSGEDFIVEHEGRVIGKIGFRAFPLIGFIFHPDSWGRGLAREALAPVIQRAFETHQLAFIDADVDPRNERSLRLLKSVNFREVGRKERTWNVGGHWCDSVYLRLSRT
jgi:RimJ/RimL family protein N-acetyltransferase